MIVQLHRLIVYSTSPDPVWCLECCVTALRCRQLLAGLRTDTAQPGLDTTTNTPDCIDTCHVSRGSTPPPTPYTWPLLVLSTSYCINSINIWPGYQQNHQPTLGNCLYIDTCHEAWTSLLIWPGQRELTNTPIQSKDICMFQTLRGLLVILSVLCVSRDNLHAYSGPCLDCWLCIFGHLVCHLIDRLQAQIKISPHTWPTSAAQLDHVLY